MNMVSLSKYVELSQGLAINAGTNHLVSNKKSADFPFPLLRIADMESNSYEKYISKSVNKNVIADSKDIIYTRTGQIGLAFTGKIGVVHNNSFIVKVINSELLPEFLYVVLRSEFVRNQALRLAKNSVQPDLTHDKFKTIKIPLPKIDTQLKIVRLYNELTKKIEQNSRANDNLAA